MASLKCNPLVGRSAVRGGPSLMLMTSVNISHYQINISPTVATRSSLWTVNMARFARFPLERPYPVFMIADCTQIDHGLPILIARA